MVKTKPSGYITKPVKNSDLLGSISLAVEQLNKDQSQNLKIKDGHSTLVISVSSILYIESEGNYINIFCHDKKYVARQSLDSIVADLDQDSFFRIHRSYLVNTSKIKRYSKKEVVLSDTTLPVSRNVAEEFESFMSSKQ
jgi:two-component system, LytTR family, response regulator LytT